MKHIFAEFEATNPEFSNLSNKDLIITTILCNLSSEAVNIENTSHCKTTNIDCRTKSERNI